MLTLQKRLHMSFAIALALVLITGATSLYYIHQFDQQVHDTLIIDIELAAAGDQLHTALQESKAAYLSYLKQPSDGQQYKIMLQNFDVFLEGVAQSQKISRINYNISIHQEMLEEGNSLKVLMEASNVTSEDRVVFETAANDYFNKAAARLETIQKHRREEMLSHRIFIDKMFARAQQNQILIIVVVLIGGIFLAFFMPRRAVWPFRSILRAFNEVWECNLSVRLPVRGADELAELSRGFNQMIAQLEELDEMKVKRIAFERRRFEVLANSLDMGVLLVAVEGKVLFVNAPAYRVFGVMSTQMINKDVEETPLPEQIKNYLQEALRTKQRIERRKWDGVFKTAEDKEVERTVTIDMMPVRTHTGDLVNILMFIEEIDTPREKRVFHRDVHVAKNSS